MADLSAIEKIKLETYFDMGGGYVADFSDRTMAEFFADSINVDIFSEKYNFRSGSKANRMRGFWSKESNFMVGKLLLDLIEHWRGVKLIRGNGEDEKAKALGDECHRIAQRLKSNGPVENIDAIKPNSDDKDFHLLSKSIRESVERNEPEAALDRLHTFVVKFVRGLCDECGITYDRDKALHSLFGEYVKHLKSEGKLQSQMSERILKTSISILEAFNDVRNNQSFAHDNPILNREESLLIFNNVSNIVRFLQSFPSKKVTAKPAPEDKWEDLPF